MKARHAASGWSPFWRDILLRSVLALLLIAMAFFIWWLFSEDELFTNAVSTTVGSTSIESVSTTVPGQAPSTTAGAEVTSPPSSTVPEATSSTTVAPTTSTTTTIPPPLDPAFLVVKVFNGNGIAGVAGRTTARLEEAGYAVDSPDNHPQFLDISRVWYREGLLREAQELQATLVPDGLVEVVPQEREGIDLIVILGRSFEE